MYESVEQLIKKEAESQKRAADRHLYNIGYAADRLSTTIDQKTEKLNARMGTETLGGKSQTIYVSEEDADTIIQKFSKGRMGSLDFNEKRLDRMGIDIDTMAPKHAEKGILTTDIKSTGGLRIQDDTKFETGLTSTAEIRPMLKTGIKDKVGQFVVAQRGARHDAWLEKHPEWPIIRQEFGLGPENRDKYEQIRYAGPGLKRANKKRGEGSYTMTQREALASGRFTKDEGPVIKWTKGGGFSAAASHEYRSMLGGDHEYHTTRPTADAIGWAGKDGNGVVMARRKKSITGTKQTEKNLLVEKMEGPDGKKRIRLTLNTVKQRQGNRFTRTLKTGTTVMKGAGKATRGVTTAMRWERYIESGQAYRIALDPIRNKLYRWGEEKAKKLGKKILRGLFALAKKLFLGLIAILPQLMIVAVIAGLLVSVFGFLIDDRSDWDKYAAFVIDEQRQLAGEIVAAGGYDSTYTVLSEKFAKTDDEKKLVQAISGPTGGSSVDVSFVGGDKLDYKALFSIAHGFYDGDTRYDTVKPVLDWGKSHMYKITYLDSNGRKVKKGSSDIATVQVKVTDYETMYREFSGGYDGTNKEALKKASSVYRDRMQVYTDLEEASDTQEQIENDEGLQEEYEENTENAGTGTRPDF